MFIEHTHFRHIIGDNPIYKMFIFHKNPHIALLKNNQDTLARNKNLEETRNISTILHTQSGRRISF